MKRKLWLLLHRYLGISAGIVLAVVGMTGALLSFEDEILDVFNHDIAQVEQRPFATPLKPDDVYRKVAAEFPDRRIQSINLFESANASVKVNLSDPNGGRRGEEWYIDPFSAETLGRVRGVSAMHFIEDVHRRLLAGEAGKTLVGACALILIFMVLSGIYLRLPTLIKSAKKKMRNAHAGKQSEGAYARFRQGMSRLWLFKRGLKGRAFWWHLHAVAGTWVIVFYLSASLTGLYFSYDWYRAGVLALAGVEQPKLRAPIKESDVNKSVDVEARALAKSWQTFEQQAPVYTQVLIRIPKDIGSYHFSYLDEHSGHERAAHRIETSYADGGLIKHEFYHDKRAGEKLVASMLPLHTGSFYGLTGKVIFFVSSAMMPLFTFSGIWLYLNRRKASVRKKRRLLKKVAGSAEENGIEGITAEV